MKSAVRFPVDGSGVRRYRRAGLKFRQAVRWLAIGLVLQVVTPESVRVATRPSRVSRNGEVLGLRADFDGDGRLDRAFLELAGRAATLRLDFADSTHASAIPLPADALTIAAIDVDDDGDNDVLVVTRSGRLTVLLNEGHGTFLPTKIQLPPQLCKSEFIPATQGVLVATCSAATILPATTRGDPGSRPNFYLVGESEVLASRPPEAFSPRGPPSRS